MSKLHFKSYRDIFHLGSVYLDCGCWILTSHNYQKSFMMYRFLKENIQSSIIQRAWKRPDGLLLGLKPFFNDVSHETRLKILEYRKEFKLTHHKTSGHISLCSCLSPFSAFLVAIPSTHCFYNQTLFRFFF